MYSSVSPKDDTWFLRVCHHISNAVHSFNIRYRQTLVPIRGLSADCVGMASDGVLGVAQCVLTASWSGRSTCMQFVVADREEGPAVSVGL